MIKIRNILNRFYHSFILPNYQVWIFILVFISAECIVNPLREFPLNDDWSYSKSVRILQFEHRFTIGDWPAMTLFTHVIWGFLFTKSFGYSLVVLRISGICASVIGSLILYSLVKKISGHKTFALCTALAVFLNPIYFNLSNTFMTDVSFTTVFIWCALLIYNFHQVQKPLTLLWIFIASSLLVLIRQFGIVVPFAFLLSCLFMKHKRWFYSLLALFCLAMVYGVFKYYENYLAGILPEHAAYKFSNSIGLKNDAFMQVLFYNIEQRIKILIVLVLTFVAPVLLIFLPGAFKASNKFVFFIVLILSFIFVNSFFREVPFPFRNIFMNMTVGYETFFQNAQSPVAHNHSDSFEKIMSMVKLILSAISIAVSVLFFINKRSTGTETVNRLPFVIFILTFFVLYLFELFISESFFDRYALPLIVSLILAVVYFTSIYKPDFKFYFLLIPFFFYVSVFGTRDYFEWNTKKWEAYRYLRDENNIPSDKINAGFEVSCWNDGRESWWANYLDLNGINYLIQFKSENGFSPLKAYEFQRYFPYKEDKIYIFVRDTIQ
ncbi:MAG: glycosyltransferase family 39 protein [Bacteroidia bacterium]|nr:glycosyltransferase family 39 protein [Bacteroidia bacterium]